MISTKDFLSLKRVSFLFLILPFFIDFILAIYNNGFFPYLNLLFVILLIIVFDFFYLLLFNNIKRKILLFIIIHSFLLFFFYYKYVLLFFTTINEHTFNVHLRGKYILPEVFGLIVYLIYKFKSSINVIFYILNILLLALSCIKVLDISNHQILEKKVIKNYPIKLKENESKPVILVIADEYASPKELFNFFKDSNIFNYQNHLINKNWIVKDRMYSANTLTINSLASLFNFNLNSSDKSLKINFSINILKASSLYDSLEKKKVKFYNHGIFDIGLSKAMSKIYYSRIEDKMQTFTKKFFSSTLIGPLLKDDSESIQVEYNRLNIEYNFNKFSKHRNNFFIYIHLLMPHAPYEYRGSHIFFKDSPSSDELRNYYNYWIFCNKTLTQFLSELTKEDKFRIILTGDHGYRSNKKINPNFTFSAFYGFDKKNTDSIKSVQDIGSLINSSY